ncbi:MAG: hypothetical protein P4L41_07765 [Flavipsychrobacter sp.]|nr:hypothetical protein [Flavipsychrobacter sp.]
MKKLFFATLLSLTGIAAYAQTSVTVTNNIATSGGGACPTTVTIKFYIQNCGGAIMAGPTVPCPSGISVYTNTGIGLSPTTQIVGCTIYSGLPGPHGTATMGDEPATACGTLTGPSYWTMYGFCCGMYNNPPVTCQEQASGQWTGGATASVLIN